MKCGLLSVKAVLKALTAHKPSRLEMCSVRSAAEMEMMRKSPGRKEKKAASFFCL